MRGRSLSKLTPPAAYKARAKTVVQPNFLIRGRRLWKDDEAIVPIQSENGNRKAVSVITQVRTERNR